jgi:transposase
MLPAQILANINPKDVLNRYIGDEATKDIAKSIGVSRPALTNWLIKVAETDWKDAQVVRAIERKALAEDELEQVATLLKEDPPPPSQEIPALTLRHKVAESQIKSAQWELERIYRRIYGDQVQETGAVIVIAIGSELRPQNPPIEGHAVRTA